MTQKQASMEYVLGQFVEKPITGQPCTLWPLYGRGQAIIFLPCGFFFYLLSFFFFPCLISAVADRMYTTLPHMV